MMPNLIIITLLIVYIPSLASQPYFSSFRWVGREREGNICLDTMDSFPCNMQECRRFKSDWSVQTKHVTTAFQPYKVHILVCLRR